MNPYEVMPQDEVELEQESRYLELERAERYWKDKAFNAFYSDKLHLWNICIARARFYYGLRVANIIY